MKERTKTKTISETPVNRGRKPNVPAALSANTAACAALALLLGIAVSTVAAGADNDNRAPEVPTTIAVPIGNKVHFHAFGVGFQIYTWNGTTWGTAVPEATLLDGNGIVGIHFAGPTWESNSGSQVVGALPPQAVPVSTNAIPWLLLQAVEESTHGPGIFANTTYIQRVNTKGGKAPLTDGTFVGQVARIPYTADYYFYRSTSN